MNSPSRVPATLLLLIGAMALGVLLGAVVSWVRADVRSADRGDLDGIRERLAAIERFLDEDRRFVRDALERMQAVGESSAPAALPAADAEAREAPVGASPVDPELRREIAALRERLDGLDRERTIAEIAAIQIELGMKCADGKVIALPDLRSMEPADRSAALRWRSFEEVQRMLGPPARMHPQGTSLLWEYDHPEGGLLGMRFVNGRVTEAWN